MKFHRYIPIAAYSFSFSAAASLLAMWLFADESILANVTLWMKPNTTLGLTLSAVALFLYAQQPLAPRRKKTADFIVSIVLAIGVLTLFEYIFSIDLAFHGFRFDEMIHLDIKNAESLAYPGRMSPNAAILFVLLGLGLITLDRPTRKGAHFSFNFFATTILLSYTAIIGYIYQASELYTIASYIRISQYTAGLFMVLAVGAIFVRPERKKLILFLSSGPEGYLMRRLLPTAMFFPVFLCWLIMHLRQLEAVNRPTGYSLLAVTLATVFSLLIWLCASAMAKIENERRRLFTQEKATLETINNVGQAFTSELNLQTLVQSVTDAATSLSGAQFGAFFYNVLNEQGESFLLYTISGAPKEAFDKFGMPRNTAVFDPTFTGKGTVRSDDITKDPRYGKSGPHHGMPAGHLAVRSYLAVSVVSRSGEVLGGLFFGHAEPGVFSEQSEKIVEGLAAQAAVAMDNARLYQQLQESINSRDEFMSIASHELKTPLTSLKLQAQIREKTLDKNDPSLFTLDRIRKFTETDIRQINRIARLVDDMLDISRISLGKLVVQKQPFDLNELIDEVVERHRGQLEHAGIALDWKHNSVELIGNWDRLRIDQVLTNLLTNATRYGSKKPIRITAEKIGNQAFLTVSDQGIGIASENHARIFERFERAVTANEVSGMGLGLYISRQIVQMHGGTIKVESELGKGASFTVQLPTS